MIIRRYILSELEDHISKKEITLIVGAWQAGKTTLMKELKKKVDAQGGKSLFLNLDFEEDKPFFETQLSLINKIRLELGQARGYVFIDEIQRKQDAGLFLKGIYDRDLPYKFIVSGSGSLELKEKIHESLAGRKRIFEVTTCSFNEFVNHKTEYRYEDRLPEFLEIEKARAKEYLREYMNFGGYPRVLLEEELEGKRAVIRDIYSSYIDRDIVGFLRIDKKESYINLIRLLSSQIGGLMNHSQISKALSISQPTLKDYLWYAEKTFIVQKITPFFRSATKEISKAPVYYFNDLGLRNYVAGQFGNVNAFSEHGLLFENFIFNILREETRNSSARIHFWRSKDGAEVDFVIDHGGQVIPIEVKCRDIKSPDVTRSFSNFIEKYKPAEAYVVNLWLEGNRVVKGTTVRFVPFYKFSERIHGLMRSG